MLYHGLMAMAGVGLLLGGWLLVQRLTALSATTPAAGGSDLAGGAVPGPAQSVAGCGGCAACGSAAPPGQRMASTDELARDGPEGDRFLR